MVLRNRLFVSLLILLMPHPTPAEAWQRACSDWTLALSNLAPFKALNPKIIFETPRLIVRPIVNSMSDAHAFETLIKRPESREFHPWIALAPSYRIFRAAMQAHQEQRGYRLAVIEKSTGRFIGFLAFSKFNRMMGTAEVGYFLNPDAWGKGYMSEAIGATFEHLKAIGIGTIQAKIQPGNARSIKLVQGLGFRFVREAKEEVGPDIIDYLVFERSL